jgi:hypothetical protein
VKQSRAKGYQTVVPIGTNNGKFVICPLTNIHQPQVYSVVTSTIASAIQQSSFRARASTEGKSRSRSISHLSARPGMDIIAGRFPGGRPLRRCREVVLNVARGGFEGGPPSTPRLANEAGKTPAGFAVRVRGLEFVVRSSEAHYFCILFLSSPSYSGNLPKHLARNTGRHKPEQHKRH